MDFIQPNDTITNDYLVKYSIHEYHNLVNYQQWENASVKEKSQGPP